MRLVMDKTSDYQSAFTLVANTINSWGDYDWS